jgi:hypothetical protein
MLDQEADKTFVRPQRCAVNTKRSFLGVVAVLVNEAKLFGWAKSSRLVAMVNSRPMALQTWTSILGP